MTIKYTPDDPRYVFLVGNKQELATIEEHFNKIPSYMFLPAYRGVPTPEIFIEKYVRGKTVIHYCFSGLWKDIYDFCKDKGIEVNELPKEFKYNSISHSKKEFMEVIQSWGLKFTPYEYQLDAAWRIINYRQSLSQLATRAGKTLIAYMVFRYAMEYLGVKRILMIVPNISLVKQAAEDFRDYKEFFTSEEIWSNGESVSTSNLTIGTFQSLSNKLNKSSKKYNPDYFTGYDMVCIDEAHTGKCQSIKNILRQPFIKDVKVKFGFSGSLPKPNTIESFTTQSFIGPIIQDIRSKELMDGGFITPISITQIRIKNDWSEELENQYIKCGEYLNSIYKTHNNNKVLLPKEKREFTMIHEKELPLIMKSIKKQSTSRQYIDYLIDMCKSQGANSLLLEQMLVHQNKKRLDVIEGILKEINKNVLVFAHHTEYLKYMEVYYKEKFPDRKIRLINGSTNQKNREKIIAEMIENNNIILFASYGCIGTGLTLKNVDYGIFAQSFKSDIINKQSLGRGLCLANDKDVYRLYDIIDCFPTNKLLIQGKAKMKLYKEEKFNTLIKNI